MTITTVLAGLIFWLNPEMLGQCRPGTHQPLPISIVGPLADRTTVKNSVFANGTGGLEPARTTPTFVLQRNRVLQAGSAPTRFAAVKGSYAGLFYAADGVSFANSGLFTATVTANGGFSGKLHLAGN